MTYPPPGPPGGHEATQSFPAGGAPPPPPPEHGGPAPVDPGAPPPHPGDDPTHAGSWPGAAPAPGPLGAGGYPPAGGYAAPDPAAPVPPVPPAPAGGRPRRSTGKVLVRAIVVLVVIGALAGTTAWGFVNRSSAEQWRDRAQDAEADLQESLDLIEVTTADLEDARTRLRDVANEAAGETDRNRILSDIVAQAPQVTGALADCQQETATLANDILATADDPDATVADLEARVDEVNQICEAALTQAEELVASIEALGI